jgi:DNA polymerase III epsilon subunit-like protein
LIILDLEATDLIKPEVSPDIQQPRIIEFAAAKLDDESMEQTAWLEFLCNPGLPIPEDAVRITGITDEMVKGEPPLVSKYRELCGFFLGEELVVAHNAPYDMGVMVMEMTRFGKQFHFPWPPKRLCSVELTQHITGRYMKLDALYEHAFGKPPKPTRHRAGGDVEILVEVARWMRGEGLL